MALPVTKEEALRRMRLMWVAYLASVVLYVYVGTMMKPSFLWLGAKSAGMIFGILSALDLLSFLYIWMKRYRPAAELVGNQPEEIHAVRRLFVGWTMLLAIAEAEILFGLAFWLGQKTFTQSLPFFVLGVLMLLSLWPRQF